mmetsp:Transcript_138122/g.240230  ORF Transcript_138122/g.240230 Transcript_138122/m.240230 type:complete len:231 (+) Transcript_138122:73-765(+)
MLHKAMLLQVVIAFVPCILAQSEEQCPGHRLQQEEASLAREVEQERLLAEQKQQSHGAFGLLQVKSQLGEKSVEDDGLSSHDELRVLSTSSKSSHSGEEGKYDERQPHEAHANDNGDVHSPEVVMKGALIAPFGKEDTARELQHHAARTQDTLVDAIENAEVAEIKRSIFRSLTRLRAAEIKEFDTIARLETQAIDEYNDNHHYRAENPLDYIHSAESTVKEDKYTSFHD